MFLLKQVFGDLSNRKDITINVIHCVSKDNAYSTNDFGKFKLM